MIVKSATNEKNENISKSRIDAVSTIEEILKIITQKSV